MYIMFLALMFRGFDLDKIIIYGKAHELHDD